MWSYESDLPTDKDKVRLLIGDTDTDDKLLADDEVQYFIDTHGALNKAAAEACRAIAAMYAREMSRSIGGLSANFSAKHTQYLALANDFDRARDLDPVPPWGSGWSKSDAETVHADTDRPAMPYKGMHDNLRTGPSVIYENDGS